MAELVMPHLAPGIFRAPLCAAQGAGALPAAVKHRLLLCAAPAFAWCLGADIEVVHLECVSAARTLNALRSDPGERILKRTRPAVFKLQPICLLQGTGADPGLLGGHEPYRLRTTS